MVRSSSADADRTPRDTTMVMWHAVSHLTGSRLRCQTARRQVADGRTRRPLITRATDVSHADRVAVAESIINRHGLRGTVRRTAVARHVVSSLLHDAHDACARIDERLLRDLQCDAVHWARVFGWWLKPSVAAASETGTQGQRPEGEWIWMCTDAASGLILACTTGPRTPAMARVVLADVTRRLAPSAAPPRHEGDLLGLETSALTRAERDPLESGGADTGLARKRAKARATLMLLCSFYNLAFVRSGETATAAMRAGVTARVWSLDEMLETAVSGCF